MLPCLSLPTHIEIMDFRLSECRRLRQTMLSTKKCAIILMTMKKIAQLLYLLRMWTIYSLGSVRTLYKWRMALLPGWNNTELVLHWEMKALTKISQQANKSISSMVEMVLINKQIMMRNLFETESDSEALLFAIWPQYILPYDMVLLILVQEIDLFQAEWAVVALSSLFSNVPIPRQMN